MTAVVVVPVEAPGKRGRLVTVRRLFAHRGARIGAIATMVVIAIGLLGPFFAPHSPSAIVGLPFQRPGPGLMLGGDFLGEDVLSRILWGGRSVIWMSIAATLVAVVAGVTIGLIAAFAGRKTDSTTVFSMDVLLALPDIVMVLMFVVLLGREKWIIAMVTALSFLPVVVRLVRSLALELLHQEFVEAALAQGFPRYRVLFFEVLPNIATPVLIQAGALLSWSVGVVAGISFLGFGVQPPNADWGLMISENFSGLTIQPLAVLAPIIMITLYTVATNSLAEGLGRSIAGVDKRSQE